MAESRALVRGYGGLLGAPLTVNVSRGGGTLPIALMRPSGFQPRREMNQDTLQELADSIKASGVIQPIIVRRLATVGADGVRYEIVTGERRWLAASMAGLSDIPTIVRELTDQEAVAIALIENIQREELTAAEEARAIKRLIAEFALTHQEVADSIGRSRAAVSNLLRLLELPAPVVQLIDSRALSMGHARALLAIVEPVEQERAASYVSERGLSVRATEELVRRAAQPDIVPVASRKPQFSLISEVLRTEHTRMQLHQRTPNSGKFVVEFSDAQARDALLALLRTYAGP